MTDELRAVGSSLWFSLEQPQTMIQIQIHRLDDGSVLAVKAPNQRDPIIGIGRTGHVVAMSKAKWEAINRVQIAYNRLQHRLAKL